MRNFIPELSESIEFSQLTDEEYILSNSKDKHYLKINADTYNLLQLVDSKRSVIEIQQLFNATFKKEIQWKQLEYLLFEKLAVYGVLKGHEKDVKPYEKPSYLKLSFIIFNETLVAKIVKYFKILFEPKVALLLVLSALTLISALAALNLNLYHSFSLQESIVCFIIIKAISTTFHEVGHAASADYFGAQHGGIGGGFYLFTPVYFADVTDVWKLDKWQRIVVNFSGMYFELIFCSVLALFSFLFQFELLTLVTIVVCASTLLNLNPFLRGDGYWILSDLLGKPNLRQHSFDKVKDVIGFIKGKRLSLSKIDLVLFLYGITSYVFITMFLYYVLFQNPNSLLSFPMDAVHFVKGVFDPLQVVTLEQYGQLLVPIIFYYLAYKLIKAGILKSLKKKDLPLKLRS